MNKVKKKLSNIEIYDCTLRDGFQGAGMATQTVDKKQRITEALDAFGIDKIEGGWPGANNVDTEFFKLMQGVKLNHAVLVAFGSTARIGVSPENDKNIQDLLESRARYVTLVGKSSYKHVREALGATGLENLDTVGSSIEYLKKHGLTVYLDAEHFFDGFKGNQKYTREVLETAKEAGADGITLCDTNGGCLPDEISRITRLTQRRLGNYPLSIHTHNDSGNAVANSLSAIKAGVISVQGTINGYGERAGNVNLCTLMPDLVFKYDYKLGINIKGLLNLANFVAAEAHMILPDNAPYIGKYAFAHKGGLHVSAVAKNSELYEHVQPEWVGNKRVIINSEYGGKANIRETAKKHGFELTDDDVKELAGKMEEMGELGEAQNYLLIRRHLGLNDLFEVVERKVTNSDYCVEAILRIKIGGSKRLVVANGTGSLNAFDTALRKGVSSEFSEIDKIKLLEYKIIVPKKGETEKYGTDAQVKVSITLSSNGDTWTTEARGEDMDKAAQSALTEGYIYWLAKNDLIKNQSSLKVESSQVK